MAITFKHDAAAFAPLTNAQQNANRKYGRSLLAQQQKYQRDDQRETQNRMYNQQQKYMDRQFDLGTMKLKQQREDDLRKADQLRQNNLRDEDFQQRQDLLTQQQTMRRDDQLWQQDQQNNQMGRNQLLQSVSPIPDNIPGWKRKELQDKMAALNQATGKGFNYTDPDVYKVVTGLRDEINDEIASLQPSKDHDELAERANERLRWRDPKTFKVQNVGEGDDPRAMGLIPGLVDKDGNFTDLESPETPEQMATQRRQQDKEAFFTKNFQGIKGSLEGDATKNNRPRSSVTADMIKEELERQYQEQENARSGFLGTGQMASPDPGQGQQAASSNLPPDTTSEEDERRYQEAMSKQGAIDRLQSGPGHTAINPTPQTNPEPTTPQPEDDLSQYRRGGKSSDVFSSPNQVPRKTETQVPLVTMQEFDKLPQGSLYRVTDPSDGKEKFAVKESDKLVPEQMFDNEETANIYQMAQNNPETKRREPQKVPSLDWSALTNAAGPGNADAYRRVQKRFPKMKPEAQSAVSIALSPESSDEAVEAAMIKLEQLGYDLMAIMQGKAEAELDNMSLGTIKRKKPDARNN